MDILYLCILLFEFQIFLKRKRIDTEGNISSGQYVAISEDIILELEPVT